MASASPPRILILNGPNLNLLGTREPEIYGSLSLDDIKTQVAGRADELGFETDFRQSNSEADLVDWIQQVRSEFHAVIINAAALTHSSVSILDALLACERPVIEVHLSNIFRREDFRHHSYVSRGADGVICGLGVRGYLLALEALQDMIPAS